MKFYNASNTVMSFYDTEFRPGDTKDVPGYINAKGFFYADNPVSPLDGRSVGSETRNTQTESTVVTEQETTETTETTEGKMEKSTKSKK